MPISTGALGARQTTPGLDRSQPQAIAPGFFASNDSGAIVNRFDLIHVASAWLLPEPASIGPA